MQKNLHKYLVKILPVKMINNTLLLLFRENILEFKILISWNHDSQMKIRENFCENSRKLLISVREIQVNKVK